MKYNNLRYGYVLENGRYLLSLEEKTKKELIQKYNANKSCIRQLSKKEIREQIKECKKGD